MTPIAPRIFILAGTAGEASSYMRAHRLSPAQVFYITSADQLRGHLNPEFVVVGSFWQRMGAISIWKALKRTITDGREMKAPDDIEKFLDPVKPKIATHPCPVCGMSTPINEFCANTPNHPRRVVEPVLPSKFKHIKPAPEPKPPNNGFKSIPK